MPADKTCPVCQSLFVDNSPNLSRQTCSPKCRYALYTTTDPDAHWTRKMRCRRLILKRAGVIVTDLEWEIITRRLQAKTCDICTAKPGYGKLGLHIDHDHTTKTFRGILCAKCNHNLEWYLELSEASKDRLHAYTTPRPK